MSKRREFQADGCAGCHKAPVSQGRSKTPVQAREIGLCIECFSHRPTREKRRIALGLPPRPKGNRWSSKRAGNRAAAGPAAGADDGRGQIVRAAGLIAVLDRVDKMLTEAEDLYTDVGELTEWVKPTLVQARSTFARLKERAEALAQLQASAEEQLELVEEHLAAQGEQFMDAKRTTHRAIAGAEADEED